MASDIVTNIAQVLYEIEPDQLSAKTLPVFNNAIERLLNVFTYLIDLPDDSDPAQRARQTVQTQWRRIIEIYCRGPKSPVSYFFMTVLYIYAGPYGLMDLDAKEDLLRWHEHFSARGTEPIEELQNERQLGYFKEAMDNLEKLQDFYDESEV